MTTLPTRPDIGRLRREARALQRACQACEPAAAARVTSALPDATPRELSLAKAQAVVARDYGFASWPALKAAVEAQRAAELEAPPKAAPQSAADVDAERLAADWFALAEAGDLRRLAQAIQAPKGRLEAAREVMRRDRSRYLAFQQALVDGMQARHPKLRYLCAHALDIFGEAWTRPALIAAMDDTAPKVRWMAMHALSCHACGDKPEKLEDHVRDRIIAAAIGDPNRKVRFHATHALAAANVRAAIRPLLEVRAHETDTKLRDAARYALWRLTGGVGSPARAAREKALRQSPSPAHSGDCEAEARSSQSPDPGGRLQER